jgi:hypothetical protein
MTSGIHGALIGARAGLGVVDPKAEQCVLPDMYICLRVHVLPCFACVVVLAHCTHFLYVYLHACAPACALAPYLCLHAGLSSFASCNSFPELKEWIQRICRCFKHVILRIYTSLHNPSRSAKLSPGVPRCWCVSFFYVFCGACMCLLYFCGACMCLHVRSFLAFYASFSFGLFLPLFMPLVSPLL